MTDAPPTPEPAATPPLRRSREHKLIAGVCGGLGRCFDMDPVVFRVALGVLGVTGGLGLIVYGFAWLLIPLEGEEENEARRMLSGRVEGHALTAVLCALVGSGLFLSMLNNSGVTSFALMLIVALSGAAYWSQHRRLAEAGPEDAAAGTDGATAGAARPHKTHKTHKVMEAPPETQAPPTPGAPSWWRDSARDSAPGAPGTGYLWGPDDDVPDTALPIRDRVSKWAHGWAGTVTGTGPYSGAAPARGAGPAPVPEPAAGPASGATPRAGSASGAGSGSGAGQGPWLGGWTFLLALVAFGLGTGLTWHHRPLSTSLEFGLAGALVVFGLGIALSSRYGRTGGGTVVAAVLTGALLTGAAALPKSVTADWSRTTWRPASQAGIHERYELGTGVGVLDLTGVPWSKPGGAAPSTVRAEVGAGKLQVVVPQDLTAELNIQVGVGDIQLPGEGPQDVDVQPGGHRRITLSPGAGHPSHGTLRLELKAGIGQVEVVRGTA
ncbi:PspC domain-containing protein [Streptomyces sp. UNOB3_S3]|uniref:PspC domain-containing protein n=1 Tax=Streptomyces sp. UNOB3_S3 TaxID=2871682 RepID=UPI001E604724|nr:PspC domain-containing protein [Streptomyces sp. UNOB3_S3]MCC3779480.1 PspC domain-containing protein [Streptomyces sp. UNOB3_S3]